MSLFFNLIGLIVFIIISILIFTPYFNKYRLLKNPENRNSSYYMSQEMFFLIFIICTAPFFFGQFSLIKYGFYFLVLINLLITGRINIRIDLIVGVYLLFFLWLVVTSVYSQSYYDAILLLIKYIMPLLSLWLGYSAIRGRYDLYYCLKYIAKYAVFYALLIGGVSAVFMPWLYFSPIGNMFLKYAGLADYFTAIFIVFFILHWITRRKKYLFGAVWLLLSTLLEVVRTGLGGMTLVVGLFVGSRYKLKSIPYIAVAAILFIGIILYVPSVNEKFFGPNAGQMQVVDFINGDALSLDNIQTSGREFLWNLVIAKFYEPSPIIGAGLGTTSHFVKMRALDINAPALLHNDYVQILCDTGIIGLVLISLFYFAVVVKVFAYVWRRHVDFWVKVCGIMSVASLAGTAFSMGFDNVVSHSMTSLIIPFIFIGFFLKFIELSKYDTLSK